MSGDDRYAIEAVSIINAWSTTLTSIAGVASDRYLAAGIYGYQYAQCVELMRSYGGFSSSNLTSAISMLKSVVWPSNQAFLLYHLNQTTTHYWANWDLCNLASAISIGIVADDSEIYQFAIDYFLNGDGEGAIDHWLWKTYSDDTAQIEEVSRRTSAVSPDMPTFFRPVEIKGTPCSILP